MWESGTLWVNYYYFVKNTLITFFQYIYSPYVVMKETRHLCSCIQNFN